MLDMCMYRLYNLPLSKKTNMLYNPLVKQFLPMDIYGTFTLVYDPLLPQKRQNSV